MRTLLDRVIGFSTRRPCTAVAGWLIFVVLLVTAGALAGVRPASAEDFQVGEAGHAEAVATPAGMLPPTTERVLITGHDRGRLPPSAGSAAVEVAIGFRAMAQVAAVRPPEEAADGRAMLVTIALTGDTAAGKTALPALDARVDRIRDRYPDLDFARTGDASASAGNGAQLGSDLSRAEMITLPATLVILFVVFGSLLAAGIPVVIAVTCIAAAMGAYSLASHALPDAGGAVSNVIVLIGMSVGVDYALFYLRRFQEDRSRVGHDDTVVERVRIAGATSGHAIVVSGIAVAVSIAALYLTDDVIFTSIATGAIIVVLIALCGSLTVLPAILVLVGRRLRSPARTAVIADRTGHWVMAPVSFALARPRTAAAVSIVTLLALAAPTATMTLRVEGIDTFPRSVPAIATYDTMVTHFPEEGAAHLVVVKAEPSQAGDVRAALTGLSARTGSDAHFATSGEWPATSRDGTVTVLRLPVRTAANDPISAQTLTTVRAQLPPTLAHIPGAGWAVTGQVARSVDYGEHQTRRLPWVIAFVLIAAFVTMSLAFRSIALGLISVLVGALPTAAALGALVLVFQDGAGTRLGIPRTGYVSAHIPLMAMTILVGLATDYQVFIVGRIHELTRTGVDMPDAIRHGIGRTAGVVSSAAMIMIAVFASFLLVELIELKQVAFALVVGVVLDVLVVRLIMLPALLHRFSAPLREPG